MPAYRWDVAAPPPPGALAGFGRIHPLTGQLLYNRGLLSPEQAKDRLSTRGDAWPDPFLLPDMDRAVDALLAARAAQQRVVVYGDFDADGITGAALLVQGLRTLGVDAHPYIPHRGREGYGLNVPAMKGLFDEGARLLISVDTGTSAVEEITSAAAFGLGVIALDHHAIPPQLPPAVAVVNPHRSGARYPFTGLSGVGVGFKFLQAVHTALGSDPSVLEGSLDIVAIGTIADIAPLQAENRWIVSQGLAIFNTAPRVGLAALMQRAGLNRGEVDARDLGFVVAPRINAMGRLDHAMASYQLLSTSDEVEAAFLAERLEDTNKARRQLTADAVALALQTVDKEDPDSPIVMVGGPEYPAGIIGLVASKLAEERYRPAVVFEQGPEHSRGSARSIPGFSIIAALAECRDLFVRYGGHPQAAGFTIESAKLPELRRRLREVAGAGLAGLDLQPVLAIEAATPLQDLLGQPKKLLDRLQPFGEGNPEPVFMTAGLRVIEARGIGSTGAHLQLQLSEAGHTWRAVGFGMGGRIGEIGRTLDVAYTLANDRWQGVDRLQLRLRDFRPVAGR